MDLEEWEEICDKCDGTGVWCNDKYSSCSYIDNILLSPCYNIGSKPSNPCICPKCQGVGKLDFIEKIVGKRSKFKSFSISWNIETEEGSKLMCSKELAKELSKELQIKVDEEILKKLKEDYIDH